MGLCPGVYDPATKSAEAIWEVDPDNEEASLERFDDSRTHERELRNMAEVIAANAGDRGFVDVIPSELVAWAVATQTISPDTELARTFERRRLPQTSDADAESGSATINIADDSLASELARARNEIGRLTTERDQLKQKTKETGKHFAEIRIRILAAALDRLATNRERCEDQKGGVVAAKLASEVNDHRFHYGFGHDDKAPSATTIRDKIAEALSGKLWK
jgi:hypothetical protein